MHKYKKWIFFPAGIILPFVLIITWFTGHRLDNQIATWLTQTSHIHGVATTWFDQEKNLLTRKATLHILISEPVQLLSLIPSLNGDNQIHRWLQKQTSLDLYIVIDHSVLPGVVRGNAHLDLKRGSFAELSEKLNIPHDLYWNINGFTGDITAGLEMKEWNWLRDEQTWLVAPLHINTEFADSEQINFSVLWQGFQWRNNNQQAQGSLADLSLEGKLLVTDGLWLMPQTKLELKELEIRQPKRQLMIKQGHWVMRIGENRDGLLSVVDVRSQSDIRSLAYSSQQSDYQLNDLKAGLTLSGVNRQGIESLLMNSGMDATDTAKWKAGLNLITRNGVQFRLDPFDLQLNRQPVKVHGEVTSRPFDISQIHQVESMRSLLQGDVSIEIAPTLPQQFSYAANLVPDLISDGYLEQSNSGYISTKIRMVNGKLSANGVAVPY